MQDEAEQKAKIDREQANELEYVDESQKSERQLLKKAKDVIMQYFYPDVGVETMKEKFVINN